ncbi:MAG: glycosyltransferase [Planctomycetota bacterium]|nr:glycosyltransferase [Planctomycetota bacterium]
MKLAVFIPTRYESRYSLLAAMGGQIGDAFARAGAIVNPTGDVRASGAVYLFLNFAQNLDTLKRWAGVDAAGRPRARTAMIQFFVDHPFALSVGQLDQLATLPHYRLLLPCVDDTHLLRLRWANLRPVRCLHGVPPESLVAPELIEPGHAAGGRDTDLLIAGSIHTPAELDALRTPIPESLRPGADAMVRFMLERPLASFGQSFELCMPSGVYASDHWLFMQRVWRYVTASLNRERRVRLVRAMQGVETSVVGPPAWGEVCDGTIRYEGEVAYADLPERLARARVHIAWGPTQFVHSFSERLLLGLGAGCACVADDRALVRAEFAECARLYDAADPAQARAQVDALLADRTLATTLARRGRDTVAQRHLWDHRLGAILAGAEDAMKAIAEPPPAPGA